MAGLPGLLQPAAHAATTFTVNSGGDGADSTFADGVCKTAAGDCTLRAAIQQANNTAGTDTINFSITGTINLTGKLPDIFTDVNINGPESSMLVVRRDTGGDYSVLTVSPGATVNVSGLTLTNGKARDGIDGPFGGGSPDKAGGVANFGVLNLTNVVVTGNRGGAGGDGISFGAPGGEGAGIYNLGGTLTMKDCVVTDNVTGQGGNGPDRAGSGGAGAGIYNTGTLTLTDCLISGNRTGHAGDSPSNMFLTTGGSGAGIFSESGTVTLLRVTIRDNITGNGGATSASAFGRGGEGAGLYFANGVGRLKDCTISGNRVGLKMSNTGSNGFGGGITNNAASLTIYGSTISDNTGDLAGGIFNFDKVSLTNSTVSGNHIIEVGYGIFSVGTLKLSNSTITGNEGIGVRNGDDVAVVRNTIIAGNGIGGGGQDVQGAFTSQGHNLVGNAGTGPGTHSTGFGSTGDQVGYAAAPIDPRLGPLQDNGGPTLTHPLLAGSPALDAGNNSLARDADDNVLTTDQRGVGRFAGSGVTPTVDIGAFELNQFMEDVSDKATNEDTPLSFTLFVGDQTVTSLTATSDNQTLVPNANINISAGGAMRTVQINPSADRFGTANITIHLNGSNEGMVSQTFALVVAPVNDAPSFTKGADQTVLEDAGARTVMNWATAVSAGPNESEQTLTFIITGNTNPGLFSAAPAVSPAGALTYAPAPNSNGSALITLALKDGGGTANGGQDTSASQTFVINVTPVNDPPVASGGTLTIDEDVSTFASFAGSDTEGDSLTFAVVTEPSHGTLSGTGNGRTYTPAANYNGADSFTYKAIDAHGAESAPATLSLTINAVNDAPVNTVPGAQATAQHTPVVFSAANSNAISVADIDAGTDAIRVTLTATNGAATLGSTAGLTFVTGDGADDASVSFTGGAAAINAALSGLSFKPAQGFSGAATLQIVTNDQGRNGSGGVLSDTDSVTINVAAGGTLQFSASAPEVNENGSSATVTVTRTGGSAGAASINYATNGGTANGGAVCGTGVDYISASGTLSWADGETASKTFAVNVCDDASVEGDETVGLSLTGVSGSATADANASATLAIRDVEPAGGFFEFSQSAYNVAESGTLTVTVRRTGATPAASVDYATDDGGTPSVAVPCSSTTGLALDRCDFTKALGTLSFAAGETEKTFKLLVGDDSYVEGPETLSLRLSNPTGGASLGAAASATVTIADDSPESAGNPIDDATKFVTQHYRDFLNRDPDASGLQFWVSGIMSCGADAGCREVKRIDTSAAFFLSIEFQETGFLAYRAYKVAFGDATSPNVAGTVPVVLLNEFLTDTQRIGQGVIVNAPGWEQALEANKQAFALEFVQQARFLTAFPLSMTAEEFVAKLDQNAGGVLSAAARAQLASSLGATPDDAAKRAAALRQVAEHETLKASEFNRAFVLMQYFGYLRRNPDEAPEPNLNFGGWRFWFSKLEEFNGDYRRAEMVKAFISSDEYRKRFGQ
ncbi:MAG: Calx-beta domain-containing protein [Pyrinomonadaceae bacterium]